MLAHLEWIEERLLIVFVVIEAIRCRHQVRLEITRAYCIDIDVLWSYVIPASDGLQINIPLIALLLWRVDHDGFCTVSFSG